VSTTHRSGRSTDVVVVGGGQAGLAMSHCLAARGVDHVVLERGEVANSWTTQRWDSLRLLSPNWMTRLPGFAYDGPDPDGFMTAAEVASLLRRYGAASGAPVESGGEVRQVRAADGGFAVATTDGSWSARAVVLASGACSDPWRPDVASALPGHLEHLDAIDYRRPGQLDDGPVLVVGGSASGLQIADELARAGRDVTLSVGEHVRVPRTYRGMDIQWWLDAVGLLDERIEDVDDVLRVRRTPSLQLLGSPERRTLDLNAVSATGVAVRGRLVGMAGPRAQFAGSLTNLCASADLKQGRLLDTIDDYVVRQGLAEEVEPADRPAPTRLPDESFDLDLDLTPFRTVVWATGYRPRYPWLDPSFLDRRGRLAHDGGVLPTPGGYALGLPFMRRRKSSFLDGVGPDAEELTDHLVGHLDRTAAGAPPTRASVRG
jgi:putative flavoprotein involved in K+ transport